VDRYKHAIYRNLSDPFLTRIIVPDAEAGSTRFHACERFDRCEHVPYADTEHRTVVYVNPVSMSVEAWKEYCKEMKGRITKGEAVTNLVREPYF
jgi:hypothetical protein